MLASLRSAAQAADAAVGRDVQQMMKFRDSLIISGAVIGYSIAVKFWPGGYDALKFYFKQPFPETTAPGWVYLFTYPFAWLKWPLSWQVLVGCSVLLVGLTGMLYGNRRWWGVLISIPFVWNVWLGQIEIVPTMGFFLTILIITGKIRPLWFGISWLTLLAKPQTGFGVLVVQFFWWSEHYREQAKELMYAGGLFASVVIVSILLWPGWVADWLSTIREFHPTWWNASIWPYGLVAWPISIYIARDVNYLGKMRIFSAASLLGSPYFALYHCTALMTLTDSLFAVVLSWLIVFIGSGVPSQWMMWGWLLPAWILLMDVIDFVSRPTPR